MRGGLTHLIERLKAHEPERVEHNPETGRYAVHTMYGPYVFRCLNQAIHCIHERNITKGDPFLYWTIAETGTWTPLPAEVVRALLRARVAGLPIS